VGVLVSGRIGPGLSQLHEAIATADHPYPIDQDLDELAAQGAELRDSLVWAHGWIIADDPEAIARGKEADDVVAFVRGRVAQLKGELPAEAPYFVLPAGAQATVKARPRTRAPHRHVAAHVQSATRPTFQNQVRVARRCDRSGLRYRACRAPPRARRRSAQPM
jgi:hypothetical protein